MQSVTRAIIYIISLILLIVGIVNVLDQLKLDEGVSWPLPIILICFGAGLPMILFAFPDMFSSETDDDNAEHIEGGGSSDSGSDGGGGD